MHFLLSSHVYTMFAQCDVIKNGAQVYFHSMTSSKFGATLFATASQRRVIRCQCYNFVEFIAKIKEVYFVLFFGGGLFRYIIKPSLL